MAWVANEVMPCEPKKESSTPIKLDFYKFWEVGPKLFREKIIVFNLVCPWVHKNIFQVVSHW